MCDIWKLILRNEIYLLDSIKIVSESHSITSLLLTNEKNNTIKQLFSSSKSRIDNLSKKRTKSSTSSTFDADKSHNDDENNNEEDDIIDEDEELRNFQRSRRANRNNVMDETEQEQKEKAQEVLEKDQMEESEENNNAALIGLIVNKLNEENEMNREDFSTSSKFYFGKYFILLVEKLVHFLQDETSKICHSKSSSVSSANYSQNFLTNVKTFKAHIFLANNLEYIYDLCIELSLIQCVHRIDSSFETNLRLLIETSVNKSCDLLEYLNSKWIKYIRLDQPLNISESSTTTTISSSRGSVKRRLSTTSTHIDLSKTHPAPVSSSIFKYSFGDAKKKRRNEFVSMFKEFICLCMRLHVHNDMLREQFQAKCREYLSDSLEYFESNGDLRIFVESYKVKLELDENLSEKLLEIFFKSL